MKFTVPLVPPSVNHYVKHTRKGRHYVTKEAQAYKEAVSLFARGDVVRAERYAVILTVYLGRGDKRDVDNLAKLPLDGLVAAGVIRSDAAVAKLTIAKFRDWANPRTEIEVGAHEE